jgi:hypothetical protein
MQFTLIWMRGASPLGTKAFDRLADATAYADENLKQVQIKFGATAAKVVGCDGTPLYLRSLSR